MSGAHNLPRMLTREQAAAHCGVTYSGFGTWMAKGLVPKAVKGTRRWDRIALDLALDAKSGVKPDGPAMSAGNDNSPKAVADKWFRETGYEGAA